MPETRPTQTRLARGGLDVRGSSAMNELELEVRGHWR